MKQPISINGQWDLFYSRFPELYDRFSHYEDSDDRIFDFIKGRFDLKNKIVLDLGAGTGRFSLLFSQLAKKVYAVEPSPEMLKVLERKMKDKGIKNIYPINKGVEDFELTDNSIDIIFSCVAMSISNHYRLEVGSGLKEMSD